MPTLGTRPKLARMAIDCFARQTYVDAELVVAEDVMLHEDLRALVGEVAS